MATPTILCQNCYDPVEFSEAHKMYSQSHLEHYRCKKETPLRVKLLSENASLPTKGSEFAAGHDLYSSEHIVIPKHGMATVKLDIAVAMLSGTYGRIAPRSGLASKFGIDVGAGVIDEDYRGPVSVVLFNHGNDDYTIKKGDRIAQLIVEKIENTKVVPCDELPWTARGPGGFGSTGF
jgi:deoxyuridine 5'-triphosphate nucleotidohydrolase